MNTSESNRFLNGIGNILFSLRPSSIRKVSFTGAFSSVFSELHTLNKMLELMFNLFKAIKSSQNHISQYYDPSR